MSEAFLDALLSLPGMYEPTVSPDGRWVAWTWFRVAPAADVYVAPSDGSQPPIRLTDTPDNTFVTSWTLDSRAVILEQDRDGNERVQLFRVELERPLHMVPLTPPDPPYFLRGGEMHPSGRWLIYGANYDFARGEEIEATWLYRHDLESGERLVLARPEEPLYYHPELNPQGTHVLYFRADRDPSGQQAWLVDIHGGGDREILNFGDDLKVDATWCADGERVLFLMEAETHRKIGIWKATGADDEIRWLIDDPGRNLEDVWTPLNTREAIVLDIRDARTHASLLDLDAGTERPMAPTAHTAIPLAPAEDGVHWLAERYSSAQPADVFRVDLARPDEGISLTRLWERTELRPENLTQAQDFRWKSSDGVEIQGWLYRARGEARGTVVYVHGGPTAHSENAINVTVQFLAASGFNVLDPNYRGSTGFSLSFQESIKEDGWGGREQDDIRSGIEALVAAGIAVPGRVGMVGTSYGGYSSWWGITHWPPEILRAAAPICGMTDLVVDYETTRPDLRPYSEEMLGGSPEEVPETYRERSPIHYVGDIRGHLLIVQGMQDPNVTPDNVRDVCTALEVAGVPYEVLAFEDEGHGITKPRNQRTLCLRLEQFFNAAFGSAGATTV